MPRMFKTVVLCLLMLAIPAQGFAASTMLYCGPAHQGMKTVQEIEQHSAHSHANILAADHHGHVLAAVAVDSVDLVASNGAGNFTIGNSNPGNSGEPEKLSCSACASCCMGAAVTASDRKLEPAGQTIERLASAPFLDIGFVTDGPRRPPRSFPA